MAYQLLKSKSADIGQEPLLLTAISNRIAERYDILASRLCSGKGHDTCASLHHYYGAGLFFCPIPSCSRHGHGFETRDKRETHTTKHQRPVKCGVTDCDFSSIGFESEAERTDHISKCHSFAQEVEMIWEDMDDRSCFRVLCVAARERELGLVQSLLSLTSRKIINRGNFGELLLAAGEGQSEDIIDLVISVCGSMRIGQLCLDGLEYALQNAAFRGLEAFVRGLCHSKLLTDFNARSRGQLSCKGKKVRPGHAPLHLAVLGRSESIVGLLLESGADASAQSRENWSTALHLAAEKGHEAIARLLLNRGVNIEAQRRYGATALHLAAENGHEAVARQILGCGADAKAMSGSGTALHLAAKKGHKAVTRLLLDHGADTKAMFVSGTALHLAAENGHEAVARLLLDRGADAKTKSDFVGSAQHLAAKNGHEAVARLLLDRGADAKAMFGSGTALHLAAMIGHEAVARLPLDRGADAKAKSDFVGSALHLAAENGHEAVARLLLDRGADIEAKRMDGSTALHAAADEGHVVITQLLLDHGADAESMNAYGWTALRLATRKGHEATAQLLRERLLRISFE